jgi:hypothetical protein
MKPLRVLIGTVMVLALVGSLALLFLSNPVWKWGAAIIALCFGTAALAKGVYLGLDNLRGKFHVILGFGAIALTAAITTTLVSSTPGLVFGLHYLARFVFIVSVAMMLLGLIRQGYTLSTLEWIQMLIVFVVLAGIGLWLFYGLYAGANLLMSILVYASLFIMLETLFVVRIYLGSNLGARWTFGAVSVLCITLGDMSMAYAMTSGLPAWEIVQYLGWCSISFIMCIISLMFD